MPRRQLSAKEILLAEETSGAPPERLAALRAANKMAGPKGLRRKRIELNKKVAAKQSMNAYDIAIDCAAVGDDGQAIAWLERALRARDPKISLIGVEPIFDGIRSDPRFASLLRQMGLNSTHSWRTYAIQFMEPLSRRSNALSGRRDRRGKGAGTSLQLSWLALETLPIAF